MALPSKQYLLATSTCSRQGFCQEPRSHQSIQIPPLTPPLPTDFLYFVKKEEARVCVTCDTAITIKLISNEYTDSIQIRKKRFKKSKQTYIILSFEMSTQKQLLTS